MHAKKILFIGGPGTGKTSVLNALKTKGFRCFEEVSRQVTLEAQKEGITQLFLKEPLLFSQKLLQGRIAQFESACQAAEPFCFLDRGIPEIAAYMAYKSEEIPPEFKKAAKKHRYDAVFIFPIWEDIYTSDSERYESLEEAKEIHQFIKKSYEDLGYRLIEIPKMNVVERADYILKKITDGYT